MATLDAAITVNNQCSSGLTAITQIANGVKAGIVTC
ncbi:hypothetical protein H1R20_g8047, partial [Candolleomyces eurysporus]